MLNSTWASCDLACLGKWMYYLDVISFVGKENCRTLVWLTFVAANGKR